MRTWIRRLTAPAFPKRPVGHFQFVPRCEPLDDRALPSASLTADLVRLGAIEGPTAGNLYLPPGKNLGPVFHLAEQLGVPTTAPPAEWLPAVLFTTLLATEGITIRLQPLPTTGADGSPNAVLISSPDGVERVPFEPSEFPVVVRVLERLESGERGMRELYGNRWADGVLTGLRSAFVQMQLLPTLLANSAPSQPAVGSGEGQPLSDRRDPPKGPLSEPFSAGPPSAWVTAAAPTADDADAHLVYATPIFVDTVESRRSESPVRSAAHRVPVADARSIDPLAFVRVDRDASGNTASPSDFTHLFEPIAADLEAGELVPFDPADLGADVARFLADLADTDAGRDPALRWWAELLTAGLALAASAARLRTAAAARKNPPLLASGGRVG